MSNRLRVMVAALAVALLCVPTAGAARGMLVGLLDEAALYDEPTSVFPLMEQARTQVLRLNLYWGGSIGVADRRPARATDPADPAYDWTLYDRTVNYAAQHKIRILFSIYGTPAWANGGAGLNVPPRAIADLNNFAYAAAKRYSGLYPASDGRALPAVKLWMAWNEPNLPIGLKQQYRRVGGRWVMQSAIDYTKICNAIYGGVHRTLIRGREGRVRSDRTARQQLADVCPADDLAARVHARRSRPRACASSTRTPTTRTTAARPRRRARSRRRRR